MTASENCQLLSEELFVDQNSPEKWSMIDDTGPHLSQRSVTESVQSYIEGVLSVCSLFLQPWGGNGVHSCILQSTGTCKTDYCLFLECSRSVGQSSL